MTLEVSTSRQANYQETGIVVRAKHPTEGWGSYDAVYLTEESMIEWLRSRGGVNQWAEQVVLILLGYKHVEEEMETRNLG